MMMRQHENPRHRKRLQHGTVWTLVEVVEQRLEIPFLAGTIRVVRHNQRVRVVRGRVPAVELAHPLLLLSSAHSSSGIPQLDGNVLRRRRG